MPPLVLLDDDPRRGYQQRPPFGGGAVLGEGEVEGEGNQLLLVGPDAAKLLVKSRLLFTLAKISWQASGSSSRSCVLAPGFSFCW